MRQSEPSSPEIPSDPSPAVQPTPGGTQLASSSSSRRERLFLQIDLELRAHQPAVLKSYAWFLAEAAQELDVSVLLSEGEVEAHKTRKTLLKSIFVHSKHRVQYEMRTYYWLIQLQKLTESTRDTYLEYVQRNLPEGVSMVVREHELRPLPRAILEDLAQRRAAQT
eukprot:snap_masked-scaffold934_size79169-processed-gene-0.21 protein:Tk02409 transcript:snap_masked-scaffold934_size79169-processed-gene-0.21-mRNA-1 annotation:"28s ribosomal protein mitochondrial"